MKTSFLNIYIIALGFTLLGVACNIESKELKINFYSDTCPSAEAIVRNITWTRVARNSSLPAKFLRMQFHDCFVQGCEGSILLDSTANSTAEKDSGVNVGLAGSYDLIDEIKAALEKTCPGVVSCSDIIALAARDSVSFQFNRSMWEVETGRRDGNVSLASLIPGNLPPPSFNFTSLEQSFANKTLSVCDLVVLSGAHTVGRARCSTFSNRLYNFTGSGDADPTYAAFLRMQCLNLTDNVTTVEMDPNSSTTFDTGYYRTVWAHKGLFTSDAALLTDSVVRQLVARLQSPAKFFKEFGKSIRKIGAIEVLTGTQGEIREKCYVVNTQQLQLLHYDA